MHMRRSVRHNWETRVLLCVTTALHFLYVLPNVLIEALETSYGGEVIRFLRAIRACYSP